MEGEVPVDHTADARPLVAVIEDNEVLSHLLADALADDGFRSVVVGQAQSAAETIQEQQPSLVILDIWLDQADGGWDVLRALREDMRTRSIPVIVCSAHAFMLGTMAAVHREPHYVYVRKPFDMDTLMQHVHDLVERRDVS